MMTKSAVLTLIFLMVFAESVFFSAAEALSPKAISLPEDLGHSVELYEPADNASPKLIIHIQDAHCNYEAQKNMAKMLEYLIKQNNLKLIMVEGGEGDVGLSYLRAYTDKKTRTEVAEEYLKTGKISGEEYLDIVSDYNMELYGIEDEGLYDAHLAAFGEVDAIMAEGTKYLEGLSRIVESLKPYLYNETLRKVEEEEKAYAQKILSLVEYCQSLKEIAQNKALELKDYPHLVTFCETARLEKKIDFKLAETERNTFIKDLAKALDEAGVKELISKSQDFKAAKIESKEYYAYLRASAKGKIDLEHNYPQLNSYISYITISKDVDARELLKEVSAVSEKIKEACFSNDEQRNLNEITKALDILKRLLTLELTPEGYEYFQANKPNFVTSSWADFLTENCQKYNLALNLPNSNVIDENLNKLEEFYQLGLEREKVFIKNIVNKMNESGEELAVLITGGFHTPGVTQMLKDKDYSYIVVTPSITQKSDSSIYFSVLRGEKKALDEALTIDEEEK